MTMKDILDLSYPQFQNILEGAGKRLNWETKLTLANNNP
jgi:hypothetical protein